MPKGERVLAQSKKDCTTTSFYFQTINLVSYCVETGEKISNLENALQNLIYLPLTICKRTLKRIYKRICKNKTCGASVVQNIKNERNNPSLYLLWFVLASITKNGEIERELGLHLVPK
jgi:hypothetical protein